VLGVIYTAARAADAKFGPSNPFYAPSALPFHAPSFDKIKDEDYQPAIEAGMAEQIAEIQAIAENPAAPMFPFSLIPRTCALPRPARVSITRLRLWGSGTCSLVPPRNPAIVC